MVGDSGQKRLSQSHLGQSPREAGGSRRPPWECKCWQKSLFYHKDTGAGKFHCGLPSSSSALGLGPTAARTNSLEAPVLGASGQATSQGSCGPGGASCRVAVVLELVSAHW